MPRTAKKINAVLDPQKRFMRSVQLDRDFRDEEALSGYVLTDHSREALARIVSGVRPKSGQRAWRITGNYGAGKSSFALLLSHWFAGHAGKLPKAIKRELPYKQVLGTKPSVIPILVTGSREPIARAVAAGITESLAPLYPVGRRPDFLKKLGKCQRQDAENLSDRDVLNALKAASQSIIADGKGSGLLLVIDELGKFLEFATMHPERQDIYLLQRLAETASRSRENPVYLVALLHQGFHEYADALPEVAQREWEKVAGRFEEILFDQPLEQLATLIGAALNVHLDKLPAGVKYDARNAMNSALDVGWYGAAPPTSRLLEDACKIFPLHPIVLPVLARFFRRFGQNERSLFSFLLSNEPFGVRAFAEGALQASPFYKLHHFYDYVRANFGHRLAVRSYRSHWNQIDSIIQSYVTSSELEMEILKTVGILNLLDADDLRPTQEMLETTIVAPENAKLRSRVSRTLKKLQSETGILHRRGRAGGFCLWSYTSVNLELAYERANDAIPNMAKASSRIKDYVETRPIVARRHYIQTGNLRYFTVNYVPVDAAPKVLDEEDYQGDGALIVLLCDTEEERKRAVKLARQCKGNPANSAIVAVPPPLSNLAGVIAEAERWEWVARNTTELENDRYAFEEVSRQERAAKTALANRLATFVGLHHFTGETSLECFHAGTRLEIESGRDLLENLSTICDHLYDKAPQIKNELVNRRFLSTAAATARMRLIERILEHPHEPLLGMEATKKPPEMSMYLSVLAAAHLHRETSNGWCISPPDKQNDPCRLLPAWQQMDDVLQKEADARVTVSDVFAELRRVPWGVRDGILPILLAAYVVANRDRVALYEDGTFCPIVRGEEFMRLVKAPGTFEIQYCRADAVRLEVLRELRQVLSKNTNGEKDEQETAVLDVVRPICVFVASLPEYVRSTTTLSDEAIAARKAVLAAHDPTRLLFYELPAACGLAPIITEDKEKDHRAQTAVFVRKLESILSELRMAYPQLLDRIRNEMKIALDLPSDTNSLRQTIGERARTVLAGISEPRLKAFALRLADNDLADTQWVESLGSFLAKRPPSKWNDTDEGKFQHQLAVLSTRFTRVEGMLFEKGVRGENSTGVRITLTTSEGEERDRVMHTKDTDETALSEIEAEIQQILSSKGKLGLVAASRVLWNSLKTTGVDDEQ